MKLDLLQLMGLFVLVSVFGSNAQLSGTDHKVIACKMDISSRVWTRMAVEARKIEDSIREKYLSEKALFGAIYRQFKGSADLLNSLPEISMLSPEALWQINQNCVQAPAGLDLLLSNAEISYPEFYQRYQADFRTLRDIVGKLRDDIKNCSPNMAGMKLGYTDN
ncbi:uncharacterized protein LOC111262612 [Varroa jacobsoni]|uniref:Uncharacterized protein n=1 Tax=Varroa destructor TaxID=109461 RepID=A0A7M7K1L0_VARDE|nr:uncharacterized protein LOC111249484 isoform X1 [Varroa destructor]XP_022692736.1 uncharacterized protein LOC111262612 [Varroa jacobsoni]